jgi:phosphoglycerate dehydrogenase-like enzyme
MAMAWSLARALPEAHRRQEKGLWDPIFRFGRLPTRALVVGYGAIGKAITRQLSAQAIAVVCAMREGREANEVLCCTKAVLGDQWREVLPTVDWCFLALPHTPETFRLFDEAALRLLPTDAVVVNVGRGETLDTSAAVRVLKDGHLLGLGLDVVDKEPLPAGHPLWRCPRVLITPHVASHHPGRIQRIESFFEDQVARYLSAKPLSDVVPLTAASALPVRRT